MWNIIIVSLLVIISIAIIISAHWERVHFKNIERNEDAIEAKEDELRSQIADMYNKVQHLA